jgi:hypothetical protein
MKRRLACALAAVCAALVCVGGGSQVWAGVPLVAGPAASAWPMLGHDAARSGLSPYVGSGSGTVRWVTPVS